MTMTIKDLFEYMQSGTDEQNEEALAVVDDIMHIIKSKYPTHYREYENRLKDIYTHHSSMSEEEAKEYVSHFDNKDGSHGEHWTLDQVKSYMKGKPEYAHLDPVCFYAAINMMYSDYYKPTRSVETYAALAKDFLEDKDAPADKLKRYFEAMHK